MLPIAALVILVAAIAIEPSRRAIGDLLGDRATATRTDGLSKTAFVLGADAALQIYERLGDVDAILVKPDGTVVYTKGLEPPPAAH